jgi:hypothetical protein
MKPFTLEIDKTSFDPNNPGDYLTKVKNSKAINQ